MGLSDYLDKPVPNNALLAAIRKALTGNPTEPGAGPVTGSSG
jgi:DNA-binding response OmpR family regulator